VTTNELLAKLQSLKDELKQQFGIEEIALFGSYARGEADEDSDVDIVILKAKERKLANRLNAIKMIENKLGKKVDMGYFDSMKTFIQNRIQKDFLYV
jgi:predicted nucleotidyltransferase